jgi:nucleoside-diphosphate-sugar epimerase
MNKLVDIIIQDAAQICDKVSFDGIIGKTILITGASGLIGGYFIACLKYLSQMRNIRFTTVAAMQNEPLPYLKELLNFDNVNIYRGDLTSAEFIGILPKADIIIHAAGYGQPGRFLQDQIKTLKLNTFSMFVLFDKLAENGKFLFVSTSELYSGLNNPPFKEHEIGTTNTVHPRACYIEAKRCGEAICNAYRTKGVDAKSVRLALAYGPGTRPGDMRVLNSFIEKALNGQITLLDQGQAKRTYCYISDAIEIMWNVLLFGKDPIYNVGGNSRTTIGELAHKTGSYLKVPVIFPADIKDMSGAPDDVYLDMTKVRLEFGKNEYVSLDEGLANTIEWQKALYGISS